MGALGATNGVDISELGRSAGGEQTTLNRRLFMQLLVFGGCRDSAALVRLLEEQNIRGTLYADLNDYLGIGLLTLSEEPGFFIDRLRPVLSSAPFSGLTLKEEMTMTGRTYSRGYEQDLQETLIERPKRRVLDPELRWAVWYPLRRSGNFEQLEEKDQRAILAEHGAIGHAFGKAGLAHDIRLDARGLNREDNDFVIGVLGRDLHPLSVVVQRMRKTRQTSQYLTHLGPFFTGRVIWQSSMNEPKSDGDE